MSRQAERRPSSDPVPAPRLTLGSCLTTHYHAGNGRMVSEYQHRAGLSFIYGDTAVHGPTQRSEPRQTLDRQPQAEQALRQQLRQLGFRTALRQSLALPKDSAEMFDRASEEDWLHFALEQLPQLREQGWDVDVRPGFLFDLTPVDGWYASARPDPNAQRFELEVGILVKGQRISLLPLLARLVRQKSSALAPPQLKRRGDDEWVRLQLDRTPRDNRPLQVAVPLAKLKPILTTLGELYLSEQPIADSLELSMADAARLGGLDGAGLHWHEGSQLLAFARALAERPSAGEPNGLGAALRPYQREGLGWLQTLRQLQVGGILGDDMGLGKTLQSLAHLLAEKNAGRLDRPALVVMPTSLIPNWQDEAARFTPQLRVAALHGAGRRAHFAKLADYDLLLTTYALLPRDIEKLKPQTFHVLILDEAQNIKNPASKAAVAACQLVARQRLCLTGTPLENHLGELWSLFQFLMPGWLGDAGAFNRDYRIPIEKHGDSARLAHLKGRINPFLLRRKKEDVARELPAKNEIVQWIELNAAQREIYENVRQAMNRKVQEEIDRKGLARSQLIILEALLKLRQVCCDVRLVAGDARPARGTTSGKLDRLMEMLEHLLAENRKVLLFSQFTSMLALIEAELEQRRIDYVQITGATKDRRQPVERFQAGEVPVFLISLKAGGTGLNLTAADTVIHYDPWWNPAAENQATDRAHRIGQDKSVFVYKLIARGTVEERILQLQAEKSDLAAGLLEGREEGWNLQQSDLDALFAPLP